MSQHTKYKRHHYRRTQYDERIKIPSKRAKQLYTARQQGEEINRNNWNLALLERECLHIYFRVRISHVYCVLVQIGL